MPRATEGGLGQGIMCAGGLTEEGYGTGQDRTCAGMGLAVWRLPGWPLTPASPHWGLSRLSRQMIFPDTLCPHPHLHWHTATPPRLQGDVPTTYLVSKASNL